MSISRHPPVHLTREQREELTGIIQSAAQSKHVRRRAMILLLLDRNRPLPGNAVRNKHPSPEDIARALDISNITVHTIIRRLAQEGLQAALHENTLNGNLRATKKMSTEPRGDRRITGPLTMWQRLKKQGTHMGRFGPAQPANYAQADTSLHSQ